MALLKLVNTPHGVHAAYHRIVKAEIHSASDTVELMVAIFASAEARAAGLSPLWHEYVRIPFADLESDPRELLYPMLSGHIDSYLKDAESDQDSTGEPSFALKGTV